MLLAHAQTRRSGLSLLEVLVALTIFLFALIVIGKLITLGTDRALDIQQQAQAAQLCQAKLAEVTWGAVSLSPQSEVPFDEDPDWTWTLDCEQQSNITGLWNVTVTVKRQRSDGSRTQISLSQMILDPAQRGTAMDSALGVQTQSADTTGAESSDPSSGSTAGASSTPSTGATSPQSAAPTSAPKTSTTPSKSSTPSKGKS